MFEARGSPVHLPRSAALHSQLNLKEHHMKLTKVAKKKVSGQVKGATCG